MYLIIKYIKEDKSTLPVVILDTQGEVLEFDNVEDATKMKELFETNSDSGHKYEVKKI